MQNITSDKPVILVMAGHDPTGGAGIQADIESIAAHDCHAATVVTCLTTQNTGKFWKSFPQQAADFQQQLDSLIQDMQFSACKIGLVTESSILSVIESILERIDPVPVVMDPVLISGSGENISDREIFLLSENSLFRNLAVITPNSMEARKLTGIDNLEKCADDLLKRGCSSVLITGTHEDTIPVINTLYLQGGESVEYTWERLPGSYHGTGCTLSSSIAANLALGFDLQQAVEKAQNYTWNTIDKALKLAKHQLHPNRLYSGTLK